MLKASPELLALNKSEGKPLDQLRKVLDTLGVDYETLSPEEGDTVVRKCMGIHLNPFLEPNSVVFCQREGDFTLITAIEQLTKVKCVSFRTQLNQGTKLLAKTDIINDPGVLEDKTAGRILVRAKGRDLYMLFEAKPSYKVGQAEASITIPDVLADETPEQTVDIYLSYKGDDPYWAELIGTIHPWNF